jgi:phosphomannomutase
VLCAEGVKVHVFDTLAPTPMLSYAVRVLHCSAGVMITASHNPAIYNGYKVYGEDGCQITDHAADLITAEIEQVSYTEAAYLPRDKAMAEGLWLPVGDDVRRSFAQACLFCRPDPVISTPVKVVYTPLHVTGLLPVREVLSRMQGVQVTEVEAQCEPDGAFPSCPKPNPELDETLAMGIALAKETEADILLATDPDCDRVGVAVRDAEGSFPASSLGFSVVQRLTCLAAWNVQRCMRVPGQTRLAALAKPGAPSQTAIAGAGMRIMTAAQASAHSLRARCHASTCPPATAMITSLGYVVQLGHILKGQRGTSS